MQNGFKEHETAQLDSDGFEKNSTVVMTDRVLEDAVTEEKSHHFIVRDVEHYDSALPKSTKVSEFDLNTDSLVNMWAISLD